MNKPGQNDQSAANAGLDLAPHNLGEQGFVANSQDFVGPAAVPACFLQNI